MCSYPPSGKARRMLLPHMLQVLPMAPRIFKFRLPSATQVLSLAAALVAYVTISHGSELAQQTRGEFLLAAIRTVAEEYMK